MTSVCKRLRAFTRESRADNLTMAAAGPGGRTRARIRALYERLREIGPNFCACASGPAEGCAKWLMRRRREADVHGIVKFYLDKS